MKLNNGRMRERSSTFCTSDKPWSSFVEFDGSTGKGIAYSVRRGIEVRLLYELPERQVPTTPFHSDERREPVRSERCP